MMSCPFDTRLARTPYLVIPKMALQAMPLLWRMAFEALLKIADEAGLETPDYYVFRGGNDEFTRARMVNEHTGFIRLVKGRADPWAFYRHANRARVRSICPTFKLKDSAS